MAFDFNKEIGEAITKGEFFCPNCHSKNIRVKDTEPDDFTLDITCSCNECDDEWTEHFNLAYAGCTTSKGEYIGVCEKCGASLDGCICGKE